MVEQVVGLEFVTSGEREIVSSIARVDSAQKKLQATSNALAQAQKRNAGSEEAVIKAYLALERSGLSYSDVLGGLRQDSQMAQKSAQQYNNALLGVDKAHKSAKSSADVFRTAMKANETALEQQTAETKQAAAADAALAREKDRLIQKLNPLRSASMLYEKELRDINEATRLGAINDRQRQQSLDALNAEFQSFSNGAQGAAMANNRFGVQSQMAGRNTNQLGVLMQQTGYQVGDFAVQVQGGTNVLVALGQQATQLVGTFGMLSKSTRMIGVFAGLGILIPILTGVGAAFMRMRESADEATKEITREVEKLSQAIGSLNSIQETTAASFDANLNSVFGETAESVSNLLAAIKEVRFENAMLPVQQTVDTVRASVDAAAIQMNRLVMLGQQSPTFRRFVSGVSDRDLENIKASVRANIELVNAQDEVRASLEAITESRSSKELIDNFASALTLVESIGGPAADDLQNALIEAAKEAGVYEEIIRQAGSATEDTGESAKTLRDSIADTGNEAIRLRDALNQVASAGVSMTDRATVLRAQIVAARAGQNVTGAGVRAETAIDLARGGATADQIARIASEAAATAVEVENLENTLSELLNPKTTKGGGRTVEEINELQQEIESLNKTAAQGVTPFDKYNTAIDRLNKLRSQGLSQAAYSMEIERLNDELGKSLPMVDDVADAFGNFLARGMTDFKSFADSIFKSFQNMLAQMIATAARNRILISLGATGSMAGTAASAGVSGAIGAGILGGVGAFASSIGTGLSVVGSGFAAGGLGGAATASMGAISGGIGMGGAAGLGTALGAAIPIIGALALAVGLFSKKVSTSLKDIDGGFSGIVKGFDVAVKDFKTIEKTVTTSRFFGLSKKTRVTTETISRDVLDSPLIAAVAEVQQSVVTAAEAFGFGADAFNNFSYKFKISLQGLSDDQKVQKINEELTRMGDAFADMLPHFSSMNELLEAAEQRYQIENRLLALQGKEAEVIVRNRERELTATHELNRDMLQLVFSLEDAAKAAQAQAAISEQRYQIENRLLALQGKEAEVLARNRERELTATHELNRSLLEQVFALEDAAQATAQAAQAADKVAQERYDLEKRLLQLQGDTQSLRERELASVHEYNREILQRIFAEEDAQAATEAATKAMDELNSALMALSENDFATMLDFNRAQAAIRMGLPVANTPDSVPMPSNTSPSTKPTGSGGTSSEVAKLRQDMKEMHKETMFAYSKLIKNSKDSRDTLRSFDIIGLPPERTA